MAKTILLADDSITIQKIVNLTFSGEGIDVVTVSNGEAALRKVNEIHPDVILADIFMPGKNGYELCEHIKNSPDLRHIPVILLVGAFEPFDGNEATRVMADGHLTKPFEIKVLISAVNSLISAASAVEGPTAAKVEPELAPIVPAPPAEAVTETTSAIVGVEPPTVVEESPKEEAESLDQVETEPGPLPVALEQPAEVEMEVAAGTAVAEPPAAVEEVPRAEGEGETERKTADLIPVPPLVSEPAAIEPEVQSKIETAAELKAEAVAQEEVPTELEKPALEEDFIAEKVPCETTVGPEEANRAALEPEGSIKEQMESPAPPVTCEPETVPPLEVAPIELEETDPLGLYAPDSVFAPVSPVMTDSASMSSRNLVVDIWESKDALAPSNDVLPELAAEEGVVIAGTGVDKVTPVPPSLGPAPAKEFLVGAGPVREELAAAENVEVGVPGIPVQQEREVFAASSLVSTEIPGQTARTAPSAGFDDPVLIERIVNKVVERLSKDAVERIAWEVVPDLAEIMIKEYVQAHFSSGENR
ncbi:MAG TPA: response regulator [Terriglobia bacterium]|nr:response regulator [Terriglobia bacterium]